MANAAATASATSSNFIIGGFGWLGGAVHTAYQPGMNFWDGVVWLYYVGRFVAANFTLLH